MENDLLSAGLQDPCSRKSWRAKCQWPCLPCFLWLLSWCLQHPLGKDYSTAFWHAMPFALGPQLFEVICHWRCHGLSFQLQPHYNSQARVGNASKDLPLEAPCRKCWSMYSLCDFGCCLTNLLFMTDPLGGPKEIWRRGQRLVHGICWWNWFHD